MSYVDIEVSLIVDPNGRVLVHELEKLIPGEEGSLSLDGPPWYRSQECSRYLLSIRVPIPSPVAPKVLKVTRQ